MLLPPFGKGDFQTSGLYYCGRRRVRGSLRHSISKHRDYIITAAGASVAASGTRFPNIGTILLRPPARSWERSVLRKMCRVQRRQHEGPRRPLRVPNCLQIVKNIRESSPVRVLLREFPGGPTVPQQDPWKQTEGPWFAFRRHRRDAPSENTL